MPGKLILPVLLFVISGLHAQTPAGNGTAGKIDAYLQSAVNAGKFNGNALVAQGGKIIFHKAYGWRDVSARSRNDTGTHFPILSITKSFTAIAMLKLCEQNKISLEDKAGKYLPDLPNGNNISIAQLLNHTSGLYNYTDGIGEDTALFNHPVDKKKMLDLIHTGPPMHAPGEDMSYNNSGYYLAGIIIEKVTGKTYEQNIREMIFGPLGMNSSGFDFRGLDPAVKAKGYQYLNDSVQQEYPYLDSTVAFSAGGIYSTITDMFKWAEAIAKKEMLSSGSWNIALTRVAGDYGIGFRINKLFGSDYIRHSGGYPGFVSDFIYYPQQGISIILLKNSGTYGEDLWPVVMGLSGLLLDKPYDLWKKRARVILPEEVLKEKEGAYVLGKLTIHFKVMDGQLYEILPGGTELLLLAEDKNNFYLENFNATVRFTTENGARIAILHEHGQDYRLKRSE